MFCARLLGIGCGAGMYRIGDLWLRAAVRLAVVLPLSGWLGLVVPANRRVACGGQLRPLALLGALR
jgi:hypothetical protein